MLSYKCNTTRESGDTLKSDGVAETREKARRPGILQTNFTPARNL